jgi:hypothetical protein
MALNLSTLTSSATSGDVLAEALTTADFLENVPVLRNLARGSQKGGDAKQGTALNQPKALPLDANGKGYLYVSGVSGNYASVPDATNLDGFGDFTFQVDNLYLPDWSPSAQVTPIAKGSSWQFSVHTSGSLRLDLSGVSSAFSDPTGLPNKTTASIRAVRAGSVLTFFYSLNNGETWVSVPYNYGGGSGTLTNDPLPLAIGAANVSSTTLGKISGAKVWNNATQSGSPVLDVDFTATKIRHNDTKFVCDSGQVVTINQSGNDPATIIKKPVLRFDGVNDGFKGLFDQTIDGGYMFAAFTVLGSGGAEWGRVFTINKTGGLDYNTTGNIFSAQESTTGDLAYASFTGNVTRHQDLFDDENGDILHEVKITNSAQSSSVNGADFQSKTGSLSLEAQEFNIGNDESGTENAAIDLEYLALFPSLTDAQADDVRNYINNRNNVFDLKDGFGYYFFDPQIFPIVSPAAFVSFWGGNIVGSDNTLNASVSQSTVNDQPTRDGYKVTFNDNADHLVVASPLSGGQAGYQIVGTSLGTFAYRVNANAVTELNLLGNLGNASYRQSGQSYGMILLPETATGADIEEARKLLIDRGASDGVSGTSLNQFWRGRTDILEFNSVNTAGVTDMSRAWQDAGLTKFALLDTSSVTNLSSAFANCNLASFPLIDCSSITQMGYAFYGNNFSDFPAIQAPLCSNFSGVWNQCSALTSFPAGAKLGTAASNVSFTSAWQSSGLTSFSTPLPTATNVNQAWYQCASLTSFSSELQTVTSANYAWSGCTSLTSFDTPLPLATQMLLTWYNCPSLTSFSSELPSAANVNQGWLNCTSLSDFSADVFANWNPSSISSGVFNNAWDGCTSLTAQSVENILTSIDASGKYATSTGASGGSALGDAGIDIDYNTATGSLSAATNAAVTSLKAKGWSIIVNNVTL